MAEVNLGLRLALAQLWGTKPVSWLKRPLVGDIGRFVSENKQLPRFVVIRLTDAHVVVWYSGNTGKTEIPWREFTRNCINTWEVTIGQAPEWLKPGVDFQINQPITLFRVTDSDDGRRRRWTDQEGKLNVDNYVLKVFSIRFDHASCFVPDLKTFVLIPLKTIAEHGCQLRTVWDILNSDDDPFADDEEDFREWLANADD